MPRTFEAKDQTGRYAALSLLANPFFGSSGYEFTLEGCEIISESNRLLGAIAASLSQANPGPIVITKNTDYPASFSVAAEARVEHTICNDNVLDVLHAYIPLFTMKTGTVRSALTLLAERLTYRDFDLTIAAYVERVLADVDTNLPSYQVMGPEVLEAFSSAFAEDRRDAIASAFGPLVSERKQEFADMADFRQQRFDGDGEGVEAGAPDSSEVDDTVGDAPGSGLAIAEDADDSTTDKPFAPVADYIIDYTREHLSPVVGRALRVYSDRGLAATADEFNITKAPRKTLLAVAQFARTRFRQVVLMWDGFEHWGEVDATLRSKIVGLLSELRWSLDGIALPVFLLEEGVAPEIEDSFASGVKMRWDFPGLEELGDDGPIPEGIVNRWFASATVPGGTPMTLADAGPHALFEAADGSLERFILLAQEAIEDAADRGASSVDDAAVNAAIAAAAAAQLGQPEVPNET